MNMLRYTICGLIAVAAALPCSAQNADAQATVETCAALITKTRNETIDIFLQARRMGDSVTALKMRGEVRDTARSCNARVAEASVSPSQLGQLAGNQLEGGDFDRGIVTLKRYMTESSVPMGDRSAAVKLVLHTFFRLTEPVLATSVRDPASTAALKDLVGVADTFGDMSVRLTARMNVAAAYHQSPAHRNESYRMSEEVIRVAASDTNTADKIKWSANVAKVVKITDAWGMADSMETQARAIRTRADLLFGRYFPYQVGLSKDGPLGKQAPALEANYWINSPSKKTRLPFGDGKLYVLDFSAHWCGPCRSTYAPLARLRSQYGKKLEVIMVTQLFGNFGGEDMELAAELDSLKVYVQSHEIEFPVAVAGNIKAKAGEQPISLNVINYGGGEEVYPSVVVVDGEGTVRGAWRGWSPEVEAGVYSAVERALGKPTSDASTPARRRSAR